MDNANPETGAESLTVDDAAKRIVGIFDEPAKPKKEVKQEQQQDDAEEVTEDAEHEDTASEDTESTQEANEAAAQELAFENLQQLAEALEVPIDDLMGKVKARVKIAGEEREVTLKELRDGYQMESDYRRKTSELSEQRKAFDAERERAAQEINARFAEAQQITGYLEHQLLGEFNSIDWNALRASNPAEFAALKQEYNDRYNQIQSVKASAANQLQAQRAELEQKRVIGLQAMLAEESQKLHAAIPEFADEAKAKELKGQLRDYLKTYGYNDQEIANVYDHRHVMILRDAMAYRAMQSKKPELTKKVINLPKVQKPGASKTKAEIKSEQVKQKLAKIRKSGSTKDLASLLLDRI